MKKDKAYLKDMLDAISDIEMFIAKVNEAEFHKNKEKKYAVVRALEIIGEAAKNLSKELRAKHKDIHWKDIAGMRDKLIHAYFGIKWELVWQTVKNKIPELKNHLLKISAEQNG
ncbi:MAG: hypothetical protein CEE38_03490 [Planctomycetes bacterium B3_Pla]|nr:MAG: hypothetical protein CEE38_03490 [Planctomycetes bacterium B3_Pla]